MDIKLGENELACIIDWFQCVYEKSQATEFEEELADKLEELRIFLIKNNSMYIYVGCNY